MLNDGESITLKVQRWEEGSVVIHPVYKPNLPSQTINALRLHLQEGVKDTVPYYWDLTAKRLIAGLLPYLRKSGFQDKEFTITARGFRPTKRFSLTVS